MSEIMKREDLIDIIADYVVDYPRFEETAHEVAEIIYDRISSQWVSEEQLEIEFNIGKWLSAALDDENVCAEMKLDIINWFTYLENRPPPIESKEEL